MNKRKGIISLVTIFVFIAILSILSAISISLFRTYETNTLLEENTKLFYTAESAAEWGLSKIKKNGIFEDEKIFYMDNYKVKIKIENITKGETTKGILVAKSIDENTKKMKTIKIKFTQKDKKLIVEDCES